MLLTFQGWIAIALCAQKYKRIKDALLLRIIHSIFNEDIYDVYTSVSIFLAMFCHFAKTKCPKQHGQKKLPHFEEESYKITKIFGGFV